MICPYLTAGVIFEVVPARERLADDNWREGNTVTVRVKLVYEDTGGIYGSHNGVGLLSVASEGDQVDR
jgi:hypothetical protein